MQRACVDAFAKLNLCLEVLNKRSDGYHNLRTIFQTISIHDTITISAELSRVTDVRLVSDVEIPGENLILRAAIAVLNACGITAEVSFELQKRIPMGGGLGGGSTDAAAVLLTLPAMLGQTLPIEKLMETGASLGSDVPFFLMGGTALGLGRGTELYPLRDAPGRPGLLVIPPVHVSTAEAYKALGRSEAIADSGMGATERAALALAYESEWAPYGVNHFEEAVFSLYPEIGWRRTELESLGASPARMTGSGSALFGLFECEARRDDAALHISEARAMPFDFVTRRQYRAAVGGSGKIDFD